jgi:hypothetical protein
MYASKQYGVGDETYTDPLTGLPVVTNIEGTDTSVSPIPATSQGPVVNAPSGLSSNGLVVAGLVAAAFVGLLLVAGKR